MVEAASLKQMFQRKNYQSRCVFIAYSGTRGNWTIELCGNLWVWKFGGGEMFFSTISKWNINQNLLRVIWWRYHCVHYQAGLKICNEWTSCRAYSLSSQTSHFFYEAKSYLKREIQFVNALYEEELNDFAYLPFQDGEWIFSLNVNKGILYVM